MPTQLTRPNIRIAAGVNWLDLHYRSWAESIDVDNLNMAAHTWCILGQLDRARFNPRSPDWLHFVDGFDHQSTVLPHHRIPTMDTAGGLGFTLARMDDGRTDRRDTYGGLTGMWAEVVLNRQRYVKELGG